MEKKTDQWYPGAGEEGDEEVGHRGFLELWKHCINYSGGYVSLYVCIVYGMYNTKSRSRYKLVTVGDYVMSI